ncbi:MAG: hypothetical protein LV479_03150 [Methylacidiphilales bacterium]|nr:hypothetical protein [Candidatus Methylacidiphilales bacterium]
MSATDLVSKRETASLLGGHGEPVSISFVNQLLAKKKLPKVRLSYRVCRIPRKAVEDYIAAHTTAQRGGI